MTLLAELQGVLEKTYRPIGVNLEDCIVGSARSLELRRAAGLAGDEFQRACTFLREDRGNLHMAIYYSDEIVCELERHDPRESLSHENIGALIPFIEEITHAVHAALAFASGRCRIHSEQFACNMELQARVDTYYILLRFCAMLQGRVTPQARAWIWARLFQDDQFDYSRPEWAKRYAIATDAAAKLITILNAMKPAERVVAIRGLRGQSLAEKLRWIRKYAG